MYQIIVYFLYSGDRVEGCVYATKEECQRRIDDYLLKHPEMAEVVEFKVAAVG